MTPNILHSHMSSLIKHISSPLHNLLLVSGFCLATFAVSASAELAAPLAFTPPSSEKETRSYEQIEYEMAQSDAIVASHQLRDFWPLKFPRKALKEKRPFNESTAKILTSLTQILLSHQAPSFEEEIPDLYALWQEDFDILDKAEAAGLYTPLTT